LVKMQENGTSDSEYIFFFVCIKENAQICLLSKKNIEICNASQYSRAWSPLLADIADWSAYSTLSVDDTAPGRYFPYLSVNRTQSLCKRCNGYSNYRGIEWQAVPLQ
jgi:hypothetical protein